MLVAYGPDDLPVVAEEAPLTTLQNWSHEHLLHCPNCRGQVHLRGGPEKRTQLHFAHQKGACAWSTEAESLRHAQGKMLLSQWLRHQFPLATVTLEERLPEPNRIADVFVRHDNGQRWAIEFQCASLDIEEWKHRHFSYRKAGIIDTWIIGNNRLDKQEAFIEAILNTAQEILFLDPLATPSRVWLRWPITRQHAQEWLNEKTSNLPVPSTLELAGWVGRIGHGLTLHTRLSEVTFNQQAHFLHPLRSALVTRSRLLQTMRTALQPDATTLSTYLHPIVGDEALRIVLLPLMKSYLLDPDLLLHYNYGRGLIDQPVSTTRRLRVQKACIWLNSLSTQGFTSTHLQHLIQTIPYVGSYASFASYAETLFVLSQSSH